MLPRFLCIGVSRAGTTWLHENLARRDDIWLPPVKEVHYFDEPALSVARRLCSLDATHRRNRRTLVRELAKAAGGRFPNDAAWMARFLLLPRGDDWYRRLFPDDHIRIVGEVTPSYAPLDDGAIARIHTMMPDAKIIYLLRNPIEQAWSWISRPNLSRRFGAIEDWPEEAIVANMIGPGARRRTDYAGNLKRWQKRYRPEQFLVKFHEELEQNPAAFLKDILAFIGNENADPGDVIDRRINPGSGKPIPERYLPLLAAAFAANIAGADEMFENAFTARWIDMAAACLERGDSDS